MDYKAQGPEKCTASILFDSAFGRPLYSSGMQFFTDHIALMEMGERSRSLSVIPSFGGGGCCIRGNRVLPSPAPSHPPLPPRPTARRVSWLVRGGLRQCRPGSCLPVSCDLFVLLPSTLPAPSLSPKPPAY